MENRVTDNAPFVQKRITAIKNQGQLIGVVPTMGALHEGHLGLVRQAKRDTDFVVVTVFVNPTQFGPNEDFDEYPRTLERDLELLRELEVDLVFTPTNATMYPPGYETYVEVTESTRRLEGASRPTHYRGVTTVVLKLLNITRADRAFFGQKDYQQCCVVRKMAVDLNVPVEIVVCPTVREPDGLALSSRNRYLSDDERTQALVLSKSLAAAQRLVDDGVYDAEEIRRRMRAIIETAPSARMDYVSIADPLTLEELADLTQERPAPAVVGMTKEVARAVALLAVRFGSTRLIDNALLL